MAHGSHVKADHQSRVRLGLSLDKHDPQGVAGFLVGARMTVTVTARHEGDLLLLEDQP